MQKFIKVKFVEEKESSGNKPFFAIRDVKGNRYTYWGDELPMTLEEGQGANVEVQTRNGYSTIRKVLPKQSVAGGGKQAFSPDRETRIARMNSLTNAVATVIEAAKAAGKKFKVNQLVPKVVATAAMYEDYIQGGLNGVKEEEAPDSESSSEQPITRRRRGKPARAARKRAKTVESDTTNDTDVDDDLGF